jgi:Domain of unknown function (DUF4157)
MQYDNPDKIHTSSSASQPAKAPSKVVNPTTGNPAQQPTWTEALGNQLPTDLQAKLTVGQPGDAYEQEADQVAEQVMRMSATSMAMPSTLLEQEEVLISKGGETGSGGSQAVEVMPPIVNSALSSGGQLLDAGTRTFMESRFGHDFSDVRVYTDKQAVESAEALNAQAYTVGKDVVFGEGQYEPGTIEGQRLLAHELAHVVQQPDRSASHLLRQTPRQIARDKHLRILAARPYYALLEWGQLTESERSLVVTYMTMFYSSEFTRSFLATISRHPRPEPVIQITNLPTVTPEQLTKQGYRLAGSISWGLTQIWVDPTGKEVRLNLPMGTSAQQAPTSSPETQELSENPPHIDLPANPVTVYGAVTAIRQDAEAIGLEAASGRAIRYADGTVEFYPAGSTIRHTYRPQSGSENAYEFYDENGDTIGEGFIVIIDFDKVFSPSSAQSP